MSPLPLGRRAAGSASRFDAQKGYAGERERGRAFFASRQGPAREFLEFPADIYERGALHCSPMPFKSRTHLLFRRNWICQFAVILKLCSVYNIAQE